MLRELSNSDIDQIYAYEILQRFVLGLIGIFIPIYIISNGNPVDLAFVYLFINAVAFAVFSIPSSYLISRIGFKHSMVASYAFYLPALIALRMYPVSVELVAFAAVTYGIGNCLHWIPLHAEFAVDTDGDRGKESGKLIGLPRISGAIAPLAGGLIMAFYGFHLLVSVAVVFLVLSSIPLLLSKDHRDPMNYSFREFLDTEHKRFASIFFLRGTDIAAGALLFPLFVFLVVGGEINAGGVKSLAAVGSIVFALTIGRVSEKFDKAKMIIAGSLLTGVLYLGRSFITNSTEAFALSFAAGLGFMIYYVPLYSIYAHVAEDEDVLEFYTFREIVLNIGKLATIAVAYFLVKNVSVDAGFKYIFVAAAFTSAAIAYYASWLENDEDV